MSAVLGSPIGLPSPGIKVPPRKKILQGRIIIFLRKREVGRDGYRPVNQHPLPSRVIISFFPIFLSYPRSRIWHRRNAIRFDSIRFRGMTMHAIFTPRFFIYFLFYPTTPFHSIKYKLYRIFRFIQFFA